MLLRVLLRCYSDQSRGDRGGAKPGVTRVALSTEWEGGTGHCCRGCCCEWLVVAAAVGEVVAGVASRCVEPVEVEGETRPVVAEVELN